MDKFKKALEATISFITISIIAIILTVILIIIKGEFWMYFITSGMIIFGIIGFIINLNKLKSINDEIKKYSKIDFIPNNIEEFFLKDYYCERIELRLKPFINYDCKIETLYTYGEKYISTLIVLENLIIEIGIMSNQLYYFAETFKTKEYELLINNLNKMYQFTELNIFKNDTFERDVIGNHDRFKLHYDNKNQEKVYEEIGDFVNKKIALCYKIIELYKENKNRL